MEASTFFICSAMSSALKDELLNLFLKDSKVFNNSGVRDGIFFLEKKVSMIPDSPFTPPRSYASKNAINFSFVSDKPFPNMASSWFLVVNIVLGGMCGGIPCACGERVFCHTEWRSDCIYAILKKSKERKKDLVWR